MRIGLFTDSYRPAVNGIVFVVDITKKHLEAMGHEVFVFCPAEGVSLRKANSDPHVIRFRSIKDVFFDDFNLSIFFPARELQKIKKLDLDVIQFFTPGQIGMMGIYAAQKTDAILVGQHSTDLAQYIEHYPAVVPGLLLLALYFPMTFKFKGKDVRELIKIYKPRRLVSKWGKEIIESLMAMTYSHCDAVISLSPKSKKQLESWRTEYDYKVLMVPTGIDALPAPTKQQITKFKASYDIAADDEVVLYVGRLSAEKNLAILIPTIKRVLKARPKARLLYVGDFDYRAVLEEMADKSGVGDRITFTGSLPRDYLGVVYAAADLFVFTSLTDTQGLVLHEAAHAGLPFVIVDPDVTQVVKDGVNGLIADNRIASLTEKIITLLSDEKMRHRFGKHSKKLAQECTEFTQTKKLEQVFIDAIAVSKKSH
jgi:glycosyltransferase involved in cell wall biosynthesis